MFSAVDFLNEMHQKGVKTSHVMNKLKATSCNFSERNLRALGLTTVDRKYLLLAVDINNKQGSFDKLAANHHVILYMGNTMQAAYSSSSPSQGLAGEYILADNRRADITPRTKYKNFL